LIAGISARRPPWRSAARAKRRTEKQVPDDGISAPFSGFPGLPAARFLAYLPAIRAHIPKEALMRIPALVILTIATVLTAAPARAQTYDPAYPVCLHVYGPAIYYECRYTSLPECNASASGRAAQCVINPYFASAQVAARRHRRIY